MRGGLGGGSIEWVAALLLALNWATVWELGGFVRWVLGLLLRPGGSSGGVVLGRSAMPLSVGALILGVDVEIFGIAPDVPFLVGINFGLLVLLLCFGEGCGLSLSASEVMAASFDDLAYPNSTIETSPSLDLRLFASSLFLPGIDVGTSAVLLWATVSAFSIPEVCFSTMPSGLDPSVGFV